MSGHLNIKLLAFTNFENLNNEQVKLFNDKLRLLVKLFIDYRLDLGGLKPNNIRSNELRKNLPNLKIINCDGSKYMKINLDSAQRELLEHLDELAQNRLKSAIPNIINWMDANIGKNSSGFCDVRNAYLHPDLFKTAKEKLQERFPTMDFNPNGSITRDSQENTSMLEKMVDTILTEIKSAFTKKYLSSEEIPYKILIP